MVVFPAGGARELLGSPSKQNGRREERKEGREGSGNSSGCRTLTVVGSERVHKKAQEGELERSRSAQSAASVKRE